MTAPLMNDALPSVVIGTSAGVEVASHFLGLTVNEWFWVMSIFYALLLVIDKGVSVYKKARYQQEWSTDYEKINKSKGDT